MAELVLELLSEEIPARMQARAADDLKRLVTDGLKAAGLEFSGARAYVTPRRLALVVDGLPEKQPDVSEERRGPRVDAPEKAQEGFRNSLPEGAVVEQRETPKGTFFFATVEKAGAATKDVLSTVVGSTLDNFPWPKSMRWGNGRERWVRPLHGVLCLFAGEVVPMSFAGVVAGKSTVGHRFLAPQRFEVKDFKDYKSKLQAAQVMLDPADRRAQIESEAKNLAKAEKLRLKDDPALLDEVTGLVEWPVVMIGTIDDEFMELPDEVLTVSMRSHQKYFACLKADGALANRFVVVANTETRDGGAKVVAGNERVLRARLADAKFFWDQDRKATLASRAPALKDRVFHAKLGTLDAKADRMESLAVAVAGAVEGADRDHVRSAARLAKADLSTGMVGEFPELQGVMGRYYALADGEAADVADAVAEHYSPLGPNDACPSKAVSVCVALADKIDTLVGFFAIDERPTGSKDPFALRRAALGVIRLVLENGLRLPLTPVFSEARALFGDVADPSDDLLAFFADRLKVHLREEGVRHDVIDAVFALGGEDDLVRLLARVRAIQEFLGTEDGADLLTAYRRAANILRIEEKKDGRSYREAVDPANFRQDEEKVLATGLAAASTKIEAALAAERFADAMTALAELRRPVDAFFDEVTVNADDAALRENRLKLLSGISSALDGIADFSLIEG